ncbi:MAG: hypothetical protein PHR56_03315 [Dehalococcoidales bacterium]|nr:hypothetical protein [Dehalococcoidales bacterium]
MSPSHIYRLSLLIILASLTLNVWVEGCKATPVKTVVKNGVSFSRDIQPVFDAKCVNCHRSTNARAGLVLESGAAYRDLVNVVSEQSALPLVTPGDAEKSYLLDKVKGTHATKGGRGGLMPPASPLPQEQLDLIARWIAEGASDN